jgi:hypothetical protein
MAIIVGDSTDGVRTGLAGRIANDIVAAFAGVTYATGTNHQKGVNALVQGFVDALNNDKVDVTSQAAGAVAASAWASGGAAIAANTDTILNCNNVDYDTDSAITTGASWHWTCPTGKGGKYHISAVATITPTTLGTLVELKLYKNGSFYRRIAFKYSDIAADYVNLGNGIDLQLADSDTIDLRIRVSNASTLGSDATNKDNGSIYLHRIAGS